MKLVTFSVGSEERTGALLDASVLLDLELAHGHVGRGSSCFGSMLALIEAGEAGLEAMHRLLHERPMEAVISTGNVRLRPPIPRPPRLRDATLFLQHMENGLLKWAQSLAARESDPSAALQTLLASGKFTLAPVFRERIIYYNADHLAVSGPDDDIVWPALSDHADYELEWACVVGHARRGMPASEARNAIFGYTIFNDWSARDLQLRFMEANLGPAEGKDFACGNSLGPCIVTRDEIARPYELRMQAHVNGALWSEGSTATMFHHFEDAIAQFSRFEDLAPGEIIGSGTVATGCGFELGRRLKDGDVVELQVEGIGVLRNTVRWAK